MQSQATIIFTGHFCIGEKIRPVQVKTITEARRLEGDLALLINDIDFKRKVVYYQMGGKELVEKHYGKRIKCGTAKPLCSFPQFEEIKSVINWKDYKDALIILNKAGKESKDHILNQQVIPRLINHYIQKQGLKNNEIRIFTEREMRNIVSTRLKKDRSKKPSSWLTLLANAGIDNEIKANISKIPTCGGILLALYEKVARLGYKKIIQLYAKEDEAAILNGIRLYRILQKNNPHDPRWQLRFENHFY
ncbi:hypothetical protein JXD20_01780 [Candidatus Peregrinibacteria bacterium]|nr:hypothetical protein [Candidatus Peregrinibacteria bacterium]